MQVDQRGALGVLPHPGHEFLEVRARVGGHLVAGMTEIVEVNAVEADSGQRGKPDTLAEIRVRDGCSRRGGEDERAGERDPVQMLPHVGNDQLGERNGTNTGLGLGRAEAVALAVVVELACTRMVRASTQHRRRNWPRTISAKIDHALAYFREIGSTEGIEIRTHGTVLYNSIYRFDDQMIVNPHVYGKMAPHAPALHLRRLSAGTLFSTYADSFDAVWATAAPHEL